MKKLREAGYRLLKTEKKECKGIIAKSSYWGNKNEVIRISNVADPAPVMWGTIQADGKVYSWIYKKFKHMPGNIYKIKQGEFAQANNKKKGQGSKALYDALKPESVLKVKGNEKQGK